MRAMLLLCAAVLATGCAFNPQQAKIAPTLQVAVTDEGKGTEVALRVVDERESESIGNRGAAFGKGAKITTEDNVVAIVQDKIREGLTNKGFAVVDYSDAAPVTLSVEIRALSYGTSVGFFTGGVEIKSALKAIGTRGESKYEKMYREDTEKRVVIVPGANKNEQMINNALSDVLRQMFDDLGLMRHLAGAVGQ